jgi:DNA-binding NtrC family response regulator
VTDNPKRRILIVDDEVDLRILLSEVLETAGYDVTTACDGLEAVAALERGAFDAALLDIQMPKMNGIQVLQHITMNYPGTKSIVLTGYSDLRYATESRKYGAVEFISKPYTLEDVLGALERYLSAQ